MKTRTDRALEISYGFAIFKRHATYHGNGNIFIFIYYGLYTRSLWLRLNMVCTIEFNFQRSNRPRVRWIHWSELYCATDGQFDHFLQDYKNERWIKGNVQQTPNSHGWQLTTFRKWLCGFIIHLLNVGFTQMCTRNDNKKTLKYF